MSTQVLRRRASTFLLSLLLVMTSLAAQETETSSSAIELQNRFIDTLVEKQIPVVVALTNLGDVEGILLDHDESVILLRRINLGFKEQLIFKGAVVAITPIQTDTEVLGL